MVIKRFIAENFRNIKSCSVDFKPGINILIGKNAQGKTNAAEGIYYFSRGKSFRGQDEGGLLKFGEEGFRISVEFEDKKGKNILEYSKFGKEKRRKINGYKTDKITEFIGKLRAVIFTPDDLNIVTEALEAKFGTPAASRLDWKALSKTDVTDLETAQKFLDFIDALEDDDDVQRVYHNAEFSEDVLSSL